MDSVADIRERSTAGGPAAPKMPWRPAKFVRSEPTLRAKSRGFASRILALATAIAVNWYFANLIPGSVFSITSLALFGWLLLVIARISSAAFTLMLPLIITRGATLLSLLVIEAGAYMPEINRVGEAGDASASFVAACAILLLVAAIAFRALEREAVIHARSPLLDRVVELLGWPVVLACLGCAALAFLHGLRGGFPLFAGIDRFLYRREYSSGLVLVLLDNKFLFSAMLGAIAFAPRHAPLLKTAAALTFVALTALYFLFGDKFFTIISEASFFAMPLLLARRGRMAGTLARLAPLAIALVCGSLGATLYIYSDYGRLPLDRTALLVGERIAGQGELWFVATRDDRRVAHWDQHLVDGNIRALDDQSPPASAFENGVETYYFIQHYSPAKLAANFRKNQGWVQLTMGTEAMALVMFGYVGVAVVMAALGLLIAFAALYLRRAFASAFPLSLFFAVWTYLQIIFASQQASLWPVAAPGQVNRLLLFLTLEIVLLAINRGQAVAGAGRERALAFARRRWA